MQGIRVKKRLFGESNAFGETTIGNTRCTINASRIRSEWRYRVVLVDRVGNADIFSRQIGESAFMGALSAMEVSDKTRPFLGFLEDFREAIGDRADAAGFFSAAEISCIARLLRGPSTIEGIAPAAEDGEDASHALMRLLGVGVVEDEQGQFSLNDDSALLGALRKDRRFAKKSGKGA